MTSWISLLVVLAACAPQVQASCAYGTHLHRRADVIHAPKFGYSAANGPANWYNLDPKANELCATGHHQSPINLADGSFNIIPASDLHIEIPNFTKGAEFENLGSTVEVVTEGLGGKITIENTTYHLKQFHFHLPSEHIDNGTSLAMEMHMVHASEDNKLAVIGVLIDLDDGAADSYKSRETRKGKTDTPATKSTVVTTVLNSVDKIATLGQTTHIKSLRMSEIVSLLNKGDFRSYSGSLTTPPCSEDVKWFVSTRKVSIPTRTYLKARSVIGYNARFPQNVPGEENILSLVADKIEHHDD
ncbi:carbonic anhydrase [Fusarium fujikuroi]|nr:carbonic anhydrase [Fusarium fujikuroi]